MIQISKQITGENKVLIKIKGSNKKEILQEFWRYINYGNSIVLRDGSEIEDDTGLNWLNDYLYNEAYFTANLKEFIRTLQSIELFKLTIDEVDYNEATNPTDPKIIEEAHKRGLKVFNDIVEENVLKIDNFID